MANEKKDLTYDEYTVTHHVTLDGIQFDSTIAAKLFKKQGKTLTEFWDTLTKQIDIKDDFLNEIIALVKGDIENTWNSVEPLTIKEILQNNNAEQRFYLLSKIDIGELEEISTKIDEQTVTKKQQKTVIGGYKEGQKPKLIDSGNIQLKTVEYEDTYTLLRVDKSALNSREDVYMVKCKDTSTDRVYYLYVNGADGDEIRKDAIAAIASTMINPDGKAFTKKQYLELVAEA